jgi:LPXTG-motif cell wall-anchored protein
MVRISTRRSLTMTTAGLGLAGLMVFASVSAASAAITTDGPINLGTAATYGVLAADTVTNTGNTVLTGDLGLSPGTSITGFDGAPDGEVNGNRHQTDAAALQAQIDTTTAYNVAASLTPTTSGVDELAGLSLAPGIYNGGALELSNNGALTLAGDSDSVWVFQAASSLTIGSGTTITITGGANSCNVFWQVGSSATIGTSAQFEGTILAHTSITATTTASITGRLLANTGAVTLDTNTITAPTGCPAAGTITDTSTQIPPSGTPTADAGTPPVSGDVDGGGIGDGTGASELAETGSNATPVLLIGGLVLLAGIGLVTVVGIRRRQAHSHNQ